MQTVDMTRIRCRAARGGRRLAVLLAVALTAGALWLVTPADADTDGINADVQSFLATQLASLPVAGRTEVLVHGTDIAAARGAVSATGMKLITTYDKIGVAAARGTAAQIAVAGNQPGITYLEGNTPIRYTLDTSNIATRGAEAVATQTGANGRPLNGSGGLSPSSTLVSIPPTRSCATRTAPVQWSRT